MNHKIMTPPGNPASREAVSTQNLPLFGTAAILAGGKSSRMGFDKQLLMEKSKRMLEQVVETLKKEFFDIIIVTSRPELYEGMDVRLCSDEYQEKGPLAGLHAAMQHTQSQYIYLLACDMPVVSLPFIQYMKECIQKKQADVCACEINGQLETFNTFYSRDLLPEVINRLENGNRSLFRFIYGTQAHIISQEETLRFDPELAMFTNINTACEYEQYLGNNMGTPEEDIAALTDRIEIIRYINGKYVKLQDLMVHEMTLQLDINGTAGRTLYCSPSELKELVVGHLYTQGYIRSLSDLLSLDLDEQTGKAFVQTVPFEKKDVSDPSMDSLVFDPTILLANQQQFYDQSTLQKATGGTHCCALCDDTGTYFSCVDISRHNSLDKLVGKALLNDISLSDKYILTSGRVPLDMLQKVVAIHAPMIVSRSTPTISAVELARESGITLLGFSRENRFNIYSAPHRLRGTDHL